MFPSSISSITHRDAVIGPYSVRFSSFLSLNFSVQTHLLRTSKSVNCLKHVPGENVNPDSLYSMKLMFSEFLNFI
jgi:hypothetical protein